MPLHFLFNFDRSYSLQGWLVKFNETSEKEPSAKQLAKEDADSVPRLANEGLGVLETVKPWIEQLRVNDGMVVRGDKAITFDEIILNNETLSVSGGIENSQYSFSIRGDIANLQAIALEVRLPNQVAQLSTTLITEPQTVRLNGNIHYRQQDVPFSALWSGSGFLPKGAQVHADTIIIEPADIGWVSKYKSPTISAKLDWSESRWHADAQLYAEPQETAGWVPLSARASLSGDLERFTLQSLAMESAWLNAQLANPVRIDWQTRSMLKEVAFTVAADLSQQPMIPVLGQVNGTVTIKANSFDVIPDFDFEFQGEALEYNNIKANKAHLLGNLRWPELELNRVELSDDFGTEITALGSANFTEKTLQDVYIQGDVVSATFKLLLPESLRWEKAGLAILLNGLWDSPTHEGQLSVTGLSSQKWSPTDVELYWEAVFAYFKTFAFMLENQQEGLALSLDGNIHYAPQQPIHLDVNGRADYKFEDFERITTRFNFLSDSTGIRLEEFIAEVGAAPFLEAKGHAPLSIYPDKKQKLELQSSESPFAFELNTTNHPIALERWLDKLGWRMLRPQASVSIQGDWKNLRGDIQLEADKITLPAKDGADSAASEANYLESVTFAIHLEKDRIEVLNSQASILNNPIDIRATLPLTEGDWQSLLEAQGLPDWSKARLALSWKDTPLSIFAPWLPEILRAKGKSDGRIMLDGRGKSISGELLLRNASTRPIQPFGSLRTIEADIEFDNNIADIKKLSATISEKSIALQGRVDFQNLEKIAYDLHLTGQKVPLVRTGGFVLRGSPDISIQTLPDGETTISGSLQLENSIMTIDMADLSLGLSGDTAESGEPARFPYFSVDAEPMRTWSLDLAVTGDTFMKVRTPGFVGEVSADYHLGGTLLEPVAVGQITLPKSRIQFPFATFTTDEVKVSTSQQEPFLPALSAQAEARAYGYDLTIDVSGNIQDPQVDFSSSPQLDSQQILLLITTGLIPDSVYGKTTQQRLSSIGFYLSKSLLADLGWLNPEENRLHIRIGEDISEAGRDTIEVEYDLTEKWSAEGQYDQFDSYNLDLKWKVYQK